MLGFGAAGSAGPLGLRSAVRVEGTGSPDIVRHQLATGKITMAEFEEICDRPPRRRRPDAELTFPPARLRRVHAASTGSVSISTHVENKTLR